MSIQRVQSIADEAIRAYDPPRFLGIMQANSGGEALQKASEYWEVPSHDLIYKNQRRAS